jgi:hypothetical protein
MIYTHIVDSDLEDAMKSFRDDWKIMNVFTLFNS